jgi:hypothetical protein
MAQGSGGAGPAASPVPGAFGGLLDAVAQASALRPPAAGASTAGSLAAPPAAGTPAAPVPPAAARIARAGSNDLAARAALLKLSADAAPWPDPSPDDAGRDAPEAAPASAPPSTDVLALAQAALLAKSLKATTYPGIVMTGNGGKSSVFTKNAGDSGNGWYFSCGCLDATVAPQAKAFTDAYQAAFSTPPSTYSPEAYDATNALLTAIKSVKDKGNVTRQAVFDAVKSVDYKGITTQIKFEPTGEVQQQVINLYQQKDGSIQLTGDITKS